MNYVKRVVAVEGDTVAMGRGILIVNHAVVSEPYATRITSRYDPRDAEFAWQREFFVGSQEERARYRPTRDTWGPLWIPGGKYFVLGDNRGNSADSRYWGFVDRADIRGRPELVYFSYDLDAEGPLSWITNIRWRRLGDLVR